MNTIIYDQNNVSIEKLSDKIFLCRLHSDGGFGSPYTGTLVIHLMDDCAVIKGFFSNETITDMYAKIRELQKFLREETGITTIKYERLKTNRNKLTVIN